LESFSLFLRGYKIFTSQSFSPRTISAQKARKVFANKFYFSFNQSSLAKISLLIIILPNHLITKAWNLKKKVQFE
jgi:hypothetical protein